MIAKPALAACCAAALLAAVPALAQTADPVPVTDPVVVTDPVAPAPDPVVVTDPVDPVDPIDPAPTPDPVVVVDPQPQPPANAGAFDALSPGGQKIATALFTAQSAAGTTWTLDDIAAARAAGGWGQVFRQMHADGAVTARNLGEVVSGRAGIVQPRPVVVSYGDSGTAALSTTRSHGRGAVTTAGGGVAMAGNHGGRASAPSTVKITGVPAHAASSHAASAAASVSHAGGNGAGQANGRGGGKHGK